MTIQIDLDKLYSTFEAASQGGGEVDFYLDTKTGEILVEIGAYPMYLDSSLSLFDYPTEKDITEDFLYETAHDFSVLPGIYIVARLDGKGFTRLTKQIHNFKKPFDKNFNDYNEWFINNR